jgi:hypothetical protein
MATQTANATTTPPPIALQLFQSVSTPKPAVAPPKVAAITATRPAIFMLLNCMASQIFNYLNCALYCYKALDASIKCVQK